MSYGHVRREDAPTRLVPAHQPGSRIRTPPSDQEKIPGGSINGVLIADGAITADKIEAGTITADEIEARSITADRIVLNAITAAEIAVGTITADEINTRSITADRLVLNSITAAEIAVGTITADEINTGAITTDKIFAGAVTAEKILGKSITAAQIAAGAITADEMTVATLSTITADIGEVTAGTIRDSASRFIIALSAQLLTITDSAATTRVRLGNLGGGGTNYGIEIRNAAGDLILGATGLGTNVVGSAQIAPGAVDSTALAGDIARVVGVTGAAPGGSPARVGDLYFVV